MTATRTATSSPAPTNVRGVDTDGAGPDSTVVLTTAVSTVFSTSFSISGTQTIPVTVPVLTTTENVVTTIRRTQSPTPVAAASGQNVGVIAGGAIGGLVMLALMLFLSIIFCRKYRRRQALKLFRETHYAGTNPVPPFADVESSMSSDHSTQFTYPMPNTAMSPVFSVPRKPVPLVDLDSAPPISSSQASPELMASTSEMTQYPAISTSFLSVQSSESGLVNPFADPVEQNPFEPSGIKLPTISEDSTPRAPLSAPPVHALFEFESSKSRRSSATSDTVGVAV